MTANIEHLIFATSDDLLAFVSTHTRGELEETLREIWQTIRDGRLFWTPFVLIGKP